MCGRYALFGPVSVSRQARDAATSLGLDLDQLNTREPQYNIAPTNRAPVIAVGEDGPAIKALRWGLIPSWSKDPSIGSKTINARAETVAEKPAFRSAFKHRRALIPASGYFEWRTECGQKQPYFIHDPSGQLLLFAGLWEAWRPDDASDWTKTFTIITGEPGRVSGDIHDRQPVILPDETWLDWLNGPPEQAGTILASVPEANLAYYAVSRAVGNPRNRGSELVRRATLG